MVLSEMRELGSATAPRIPHWPRRSTTGAAYGDCHRPNPACMSALGSVDYCVAASDIDAAVAELNHAITSGDRFLLKGQRGLLHGGSAMRYAPR